MKIAIVGSQGMLGQELARVYQKEMPLLLSRRDLDITDENTVRMWIEKNQPDIVFNAAAYNDVDGAEQDEARAMAINAEGPGYLSAALARSGGILVHYSTEYVFKGDRQRGYTEDAKPDPQSVYGRSKYRGEQAVLHNSSKSYVIRLSRLFGKAGAGDSGKKSFVEKVLERAQSQQVVQVVDEEVSSPTYAPDLAAQSKYVLDHGLAFGIYHVTNTGSCSWYEFAQEIFRLANIHVTLEAVPGSTFPRPAARPQCAVLQNTKLPPLRTWQSALAAFIRQS
ncbi:MAG: dTDP-4-dehydrorhamnose reductase [Patescibacteria group bacterium]